MSRATETDTKAIGGSIPVATRLINVLNVIGSVELCFDLPLDPTDPQPALHLVRVRFPQSDLSIAITILRTTPAQHRDENLCCSQLVHTAESVLARNESFVKVAALGYHGPQLEHKTMAALLLHLQNMKRAISGKTLATFEFEWNRSVMMARLAAAAAAESKATIYPQGCVNCSYSNENTVYRYCKNCYQLQTKNISMQVGGTATPHC